MARKLCTVCNVRKGTTVNGKDFADMCDPCYQESGWENTHSDGDHENIAAGNVVFGMTTHKTRAAFEAWLKEEREGCWLCFPELNEAKKPARGVAATKVQGFRRTQLNHKDMCTHAQTPKARKTCKEAFWAGVKVMVAEGNLTEDQAWEHCIKHLSTEQAANQALQAIEPKATKWTVAPRGPKGGVINQLKAAKPTK
jgi:hypothetical protein